ncbi:hypothetical protein PSJ60_24130 [Escherichia coli]|uniref:hypothetical protein n=1 Tax=Escherichia coli TaxID=562 RepID=UPI00235A31DF|nr:hypothetical protein [Escherichia coli]MDC9067870.1 hypothetical protein [Escherichia coli]
MMNEQEDIKTAAELEAEARERARAKIDGDKPAAGGATRTATGGAAREAPQPPLARAGRHQPWCYWSLSPPAGLP